EGQGRGLEAGAGVLDLDGERVVELGDVPGRELDVDDGAGDAGDASGGTGRLGGGGLAVSGGGHVRSLHVVPTRGAVGLCQRSVRPDPERASAPPTISVISWVISAWRAEFASRVNLLICVSALSVADFIARCVEACSEAIACSRMLMIRDSTYRGSSSAMTVSASGGNSSRGQVAAFAASTVPRPIGTMRTDRALWLTRLSNRVETTYSSSRCTERSSVERSSVRAAAISRPRAGSSSSL